MDVVADALKDALLMAWAVGWALVLGFAISAIVQAWVPRERVQRRLGGDGPRPIAWATGLGAASSSCSYAAVAIARSLFARGASAASSLAFQAASTNLVWELGLVLWTLIGWQFTLAEYAGGVVMIVLMSLLLRRFVPPGLEDAARANAQAAEHDGCEHHDHGHAHGHDHGAAAPAGGHRWTSIDAWTDVAVNFRADLQMMGKEIAIGFLLAGAIAQLGTDVFSTVLALDAPRGVQAVENVIVGPLIAVASFVCSVGNVPLAAVLWSQGMTFSGVLAFLLADLIVLPIIAIYRKVYGPRYALAITGLMFVAMVGAASIVGVVFGVTGLIPTGPRPTSDDVFGAVHADHTLVLNVVAAVVFVALMALTVRRQRAQRLHPASS
jgi:uncharacterized protein